ncbi:MAG TPA: AMP-binding protein [Sporichthyaceae bacterium]|jgi:fatty-acyl-CoA synthase|nr:AMP-binding protein [Sporichthyaceae bacterium]
MTTAEPAYSSGTSTVPLLGETLGAILARIASAHPTAEAVVDVPARRRWTYAELNAHVRRLAAGLLAAGVRPGDRVSLWAPNCGEWILLQHATALMGAILVNVNPAYRTHELSYVLRQSGSRMLVAVPQFKASDYRAMVAEVAPDCPDLRDVVYIGEDSWTQLVTGTEPTPELDEIAAGLSFDDPINIQYTSGTTGFPKGATLTHHNIANNGLFLGEVMRYTPADRVCVPVPFYHCFGMVIGNLAALTHASAVVIPAPSFDPAATLAAVAAERCTSLYGVPTMFIAMLADPSRPDLDLSSLRTGMMAGATCPVEVMKRVINEFGMTEVTIGYGMTETSPVSTQTRIGDDLERQTGTVGRVHPHIEVAIVDPETNKVVARGQRGEFRTRGYHVMRGYWEEPDKTADAIDAGGWMKTGDLAEMDSEGYVRIVGRIKDTVIRGGENIAPREVEEFLYSHPAIIDVQVVGVPDVKFGEELCACVRLSEGATLDAAGVKEFCSGKISHHKIPRYVEVVDAYPMTVTGKVQKYLLRQAMIDRLGLDPEAGR